MKRMILIFSLAGLLACKKEQTQAPRADFFKDEQDALKTVQNILDKRPGIEHINKVSSISYIDTRTKSVAFVFYESDKGLQNIVFQKDRTSLQTNNYSITKCEGEECACKVNAVISDNGDVTMSCSCKSCSMVTTGTETTNMPTTN